MLYFSTRLRILGENKMLYTGNLTGEQINRSKGRQGICTHFGKTGKRTCVTEVQGGEKEKGTNVAVAIFSSGAIVFGLEEKKLERWRARKSQLTE